MIINHFKFNLRKKVFINLILGKVITNYPVRNVSDKENVKNTVPKKKNNMIIVKTCDFFNFFYYLYKQL